MSGEATPIKVITVASIMVIDMGERTSRFLPQGWRYRPVTRYRVRVGPSVHEYVVHFHRSTSLFSSDSTTAAV